MAYSLQAFAVNQIYTAAQANQTEQSIRDHVHGQDGVAAVGLSWDYSVKDAGFTLSTTDFGKHFLMQPIPYTSGTMTVDFQAIATLGQGFAATFTNVGSRGTILLQPDGNEKIDAGSEFCLGIGETAIVHCTGSEFLVHTNRYDRTLIHTEIGSTGNINAGTYTVSWNNAWDSFDAISADVSFKAENNNGSYAVRIWGASQNIGDPVIGDWIHGRWFAPTLSASSIFITSVGERVARIEGWLAGTAGSTIGQGLTYGKTSVFSYEALDMTVGMSEGTNPRISNFTMRVYGHRRGRSIGMNDAPTLTL